MTDLDLEPLREDDVDAAEQLAQDAFWRMESALSARASAEPLPWERDFTEAWKRRTRHFLETDPGGCWAARHEDRLIGVATSILREELWILATFAISPHAQGRGAGRALLDRALGYAGGSRQAMFSASADPRALRLYHAAGFTLVSQTTMTGSVDRSALPSVRGVRAGSGTDRELLDEVDRAVRGAGHGPDHGLMTALWDLHVADAPGARGYAYRDGSRVELLAADNPQTASRLLWECLAHSDGRAQIPRITDANSWALDIGFAAGLSPAQTGYLALLGMSPPTNYLHNGEVL